MDIYLNLMYSMVENHAVCTKSTVPSTTSFQGPHCTSEHEMIRRGSNFSPTATRVRHNWCTPTIHVSVYQGMQLQVYGYGEVDIQKVSQRLRHAASKISTPKCDTCFGLVNWGGGGNKKILELISKCKRN
jgi:hypothetical protein